MKKVYGAEEEEAAYCVERLLALMALCVKHSGSFTSRTAQGMMNAAEEALEKAFDAPEGGGSTGCLEGDGYVNFETPGVASIGMRNEEQYATQCIEMMKKPS